ncbi:PRC and DUF2382 domain-containing protein [Kitasatospora sp. NPDC085895]|uniref:PRC and DUF2382 domain-containing protein n=1 Tax=Kitasatospora sp. NPDC085895 TaxID=3155057 RepID=UPI00344E772A
MISEEQIGTVLEHPVYDVEGNRIGDAKHVFLDDATGQPEWVSVKTGLFGMSESFVPLKDARLVEDHLEVPFTKDKVKDAPNVDVDSGLHLSAAEEHRLYDYYELAWDEAWQRANEPGEHGWARDTDTGTDTEGIAGTGGTAGTGMGDRSDATSVRERGEAMSRGAEEAAIGAGLRGGGDMDEAMTRSEEEMHVGTERVETGRARLRKYVVTENVQKTVPVRHEEVRIEREPITDANRDAAMSGEDITESEHEVTLHAERPVVATETVPVERVRLNTEEVVEEETVSGEVRKERIKDEGVEDAGPDDEGGPGTGRRI